MNIALIGYGKMGHAIEAEAIKQGHTIGATVDNDSEWAEREARIKACDVAVEFTTPTTAVGNIRRCFALGLPVVVGTTGWYDHLPTLVEECRQQELSLFVASNFSIGMNIMFDLNRRLAQMMNRYPAYCVRIDETHHIHKLDAPSGTAITLANDIIGLLDRKTGWQLGEQAADTDIAISAHREGEVAGIHTVTYDSEVDTITLSHSAKSRKGLALGALLAAEFLNGKKGYFTMQDLLNA